MQSQSRASVALIDTHCHFYFPPFSGNEAASLSLAAAAGVTQIIVPAVEACYFERILSLSATYPAVYAALGLHPLYVARHRDDDVARLEECLRQRSSRLVAVGEIGLDLYMDDPRFERQCGLLNAQLRLAQRYDLPVIVHSRRTHDRLAQLLRRTEVARKGVIHGFAGSYEQAMAFIRLGYYIGVGGTITYERASKTRRAIARLPLDRLLLETDAPDMPLSGFQGRPNRPERTAAVFQALCALRSEHPLGIAQRLYENTLTLFRLFDAGAQRGVPVV